jgi:hypothetical protein
LRFKTADAIKIIPIYDEFYNIDQIIYYYDEQIVKDNKQKPYEVDAEGRVPDKALLKMVKGADLPGAAGIKFLLKNTLLTGEIYHYFDMSSVYRNITSTDDKQWERQVEDAVLTITPKKYLVGATKYKYEGKLLPCLLIVEN